MDDAIAFFAAYSVMFSCFFADHEHVFLANPRIFCIFIFIYNSMLHFSAYHDIVYCSWRFVCNLHAYSACLQYMEDTGRSKIRQTFWSFRGFRTKSIGLECPSRFSQGIPHDNVNVD